ncbi:hypothetical protein [Clostridium sp.]|uniref:hypothetical protein n=1 Tax=Clostridium sp. TaxID=1506 RepID=UPI00260C0CD0|nr:hypothetical protein [uncultured Clostridium sp.]
MNLTSLTSEFSKITDGNKGNSIFTNEISNDIQNKQITLTSATTVISDAMDKLLLKILKQLGKKEIDGEVITELKKITRQIDQDKDNNR